jgi:Trp operon repressor
MPTATLNLSHQGLDRSDVMRRVLERRLSQREAATMLGISLRQTERLFACAFHAS